LGTSLTIPTNIFQAFHYCHDPRLLLFHQRHFNLMQKLIVGVTGCTLAEVQSLYRELESQQQFLSDVAKTYNQVIDYDLVSTNFMHLAAIDPTNPLRVMQEEAGGLFFAVSAYYVIVRLLKPAVIVETGGTPGNSSAFVLQALKENDHGELHTVDLPPQGDFVGYEGHGGWLHEQMPAGQHSGWIIPHSLRSRHHQHLGDAKVELPRLLEELGEIDVFIHDSDHSYEHMQWEFATAWPHVRAGGLILSDDVPTNSAWDEFTAAHNLQGFRAGGTGAALKPALEI